MRAYNFLYFRYTNKSNYFKYSNIRYFWAIWWWSLS